MANIGKITWFILKGEDLKRDKKILFPFYRTLPEDFSSADLTFQDDLTMDESAKASPYPKEGVTKLNCTLTCDLSSVDRQYFKKRTGVDGRAYVDVHYDLVVTTKSAMMKFSLEVQGRELGSVEANYD